MFIRGVQSITYNHILFNNISTVINPAAVGLSHTVGLCWCKNLSKNIKIDKYVLEACSVVTVYFVQLEAVGRRSAGIVRYNRDSMR